MAATRPFLCVAVLAAVWVITLTACAPRSGATTPPTILAASNSADGGHQGWFELLVDEKRDVLIAVSPRELGRDPVLRMLLQQGMTLALENAHRRGAVSTLEAILRAEDLLVAVRDRGGRNVVAILSGVPSDLSPSALLDDDGRPLLSELRLDRGRFKVFAGSSQERKLRLFELPGGTWVLGVGEGADRAEATFARVEAAAHSPKMHPPVSARVTGAMLAALKDLAGPALRPVAQGLESATVTVTTELAGAPQAGAPGEVRREDGPRRIGAADSRRRARLRLELAYVEARFAKASEPVAARASELVVGRFDWPVQPRVTREGSTVAVEVAIEAIETGAAKPKP